MPQCLFYGKHAALVDSPSGGVLTESGGNQCALIIESYAPCKLELAGHAPVLENCDRNGCGRAVLFATFRVLPPVASTQYPD
jgi:hypothetical protein